MLRKLIILILIILLTGCITVKRKVLSPKALSPKDLMKLAQIAMDAKVTALPEDESPDAADIGYIIVDIGGTPTSKKAEWGNIITKAHGLGAWKFLYTGASGYISSLALGADNTLPFSIGPSGIPEWRAILYSDITAFTEANFYTLLNDVIQFYETGDEDTIAAAIGANILLYSQIAAFTEAQLYGRLSNVSDFCQPSVAETIIADWTHKWSHLTEHSSDPTWSGGIWGRVDGIYDPSSLGLGYSYFGIYNSNTSTFVANFDERGALHTSKFTTAETEILPIAYWIDGASAPDALETITSGTEKVNVRTFQPAADEDVLAEWLAPLDLDITSGVKYRIILYLTVATGSSSETVQFEMAGCSLGDGDALDCTLGTVQTSATGARSDVQYDRVATAWSSAMTSTHITDLAIGESVIFKLNRDSGVGSDYEQLIGASQIELKYKRFHNATF